MTTTDQSATTARTSETSVPLVDLLDERWSPRSFDPTATVSDDQVTALLEAARWAPSALNLQPRRFIVGRRGTATFDTILANLMGFNTLWAGNAAALVVAIAETESEAGDARAGAQYDLGLAVSALTVQAHAEGLHVHQMAGIEVDGLRSAFDLPARLLPVTVSAVGVVAPADQLPEKLAERETLPRTRLELDSLVLRRD
ncbi:nitroreductase family protein [Frondihabitans sp. VKM Ac-2883]|uniref:nitroreductase family protein n=1 Tax=Frondihabitans sp. VKM Ac-2883 TaxID=2783823 RepID=UPI00188DAE6C|nr:nitroreductase family protein [Frondihabitans sp. VKM Ac-2883]MBF4575762.1 nitroreductase family protein [Frondihabitans sp. VKM Ac-2883]